jgi:hypothetical protein
MTKHPIPPLIGFFKHIKDRRIERNKAYPLRLPFFPYYSKMYLLLWRNDGKAEICIFLCPDTRYR